MFFPEKIAKSIVNYQGRLFDIEKSDIRYNIGLVRSVVDYGHTFDKLDMHDDLAACLSNTR